MATSLQKWEMNAGERALIFCCAVGAGHAPPATWRQRNIYGSFVGAAYMPPAAANPTMQPNGETARASNARPYIVA